MKLARQHTITATLLSIELHNASQEISGWLFCWLVTMILAIEKPIMIAPSPSTAMSATFCTMEIWTRATRKTGNAMTEVGSVQVQMTANSGKHPEHLLKTSEIMSTAVLYRRLIRDRSTLSGVWQSPKIVSFHEVSLHRVVVVYQSQTKCKTPGR